MGCNVLPVDCLKVDTFEDNGGHTQIKQYCNLERVSLDDDAAVKMEQLNEIYLCIGPIYVHSHSIPAKIIFEQYDVHEYFQILFLFSLTFVVSLDIINTLHDAGNCMTGKYIKTFITH